MLEKYEDNEIILIDTFGYLIFEVQSATEKALELKQEDIDSYQNQYNALIQEAKKSLQKFLKQVCLQSKKQQKR